MNSWKSKCSVFPLYLSKKILVRNVVIFFIHFSFHLNSIKIKILYPVCYIIWNSGSELELSIQFWMEHNPVMAM